MEDDPDNSYSFSEQFYSNQGYRTTWLDVLKIYWILHWQIQKQKIKAEYVKDNANALNMDTLVRLFAVFNDASNNQFQ